MDDASSSSSPFDLLSSSLHSLLLPDTGTSSGNSSITLLLTATLLVLYRLLYERPRLEYESFHLRSFPRSEMLVPGDEIRRFDNVGVVEC